MHFGIYSSYDGWEIQMLDGNDVRGCWSWDHEDFEAGVGGEKLVADILRALGHTVYQEEDY